ncbi:cytochrome c oxidase subunit 5b-1, mitochondrial isoform X1 [Daucus carota subsp. sativus]|uniref:cytochrome c oxidase subunit 5b-1, mitochondrial isoform X1 n=1 Tax=Daucus carota subsp. sativus TaxID=79200 RepID=UPI0007F01030|nr:PREDICTED: cytochrome c oxidase subunit 5b-1, mitochondrial isoform X3 [Daucus carota subsp. sativus]XP_017255355.1 PREDICTED: cytochrome c oxidase subunit 5b-1, mitochondrial isoform X3 [Daucus carota subsp. sativus]XP_017255356.1 PREDICTED: cytochrome c oxidase subunit 5b-1, mitochondrial isoform X3 [Daucus carota subsp. sativus]
MLSQVPPSHSNGPDLFVKQTSFGSAIVLEEKLLKPLKLLETSTTMWRRRLSTHLTALSLPASFSSPLTAASSSTTSFRPIFSLLSRHFTAPSDYAAGATESENVGISKKTVGDVKREELEALLDGHQIRDVDYPEGHFGTKKSPALIKSYYDKRIIGCPGPDGEDEHDIVWLWLEKGKPRECPVCSQYFELEVVAGPGGSPDGHDDENQH